MVELYWQLDGAGLPTAGGARVPACSGVAIRMAIVSIFFMIGPSFLVYGEIMRFLYLLNLDTGERAEETDVSDMRPMEIIALESRLWAKIEDPWVVRDSNLDTPTRAD
jgi:hypothetical protein